jgi:hypothetical protein
VLIYSNNFKKIGYIFYNFKIKMKKNEENLNLSLVVITIQIDKNTFVKYLI